MLDLGGVLIMLVTIVVVMGFVLTTMAYLTYAERKVMARMQVRLGPMRTGPGGLLQPLADGVKLLAKEDTIPARADKWVFMIAPMVSFIMAVLAFAVIPFGPTVNLFGRAVNFWIADVNIGLLFVLATGSMGVYGIVMGAWASNNKYALLGGLRSSAQVISYEVSLGLALIGSLILAGTFSLNGIIEAQQQPLLWFLPRWFIFLQPLGFIIYLISAVAETNRPPFDLPEAESELVAGFHTEYSGFRWAFYFLGEYIGMLVVSAVATIVFLGGWDGPFGIPVIWFLVKMSLFIFLYYWLRSTLPRLRFDQLMGLCWKILLPLALLNLLLTGVIRLLTT